MFALQWDTKFLLPSLLHACETCSHDNRTSLRSAVDRRLPLCPPSWLLTSPRRTEPPWLCSSPPIPWVIFLFRPTGSAWLRALSHPLQLWYDRLFVLPPPAVPLTLDVTALPPPASSLWDPSPGPYFSHPQHSYWHPYATPGSPPVDVNPSKL